MNYTTPVSVYFHVPIAPPPRHIYLHVPFCRRRCSYCDFAIAVRRTVPVDDYVALLTHEVAVRYPEQLPWDIDTLYLGGGTPSLLGADGITRLLAALRDRLAWDHRAEVTIEANPDDIDESSARAWHTAGVNRLSIGAQSFDDGALAWMHRTHDAARIAQSVEAARAAGIENISLDLIFALPDSVRRAWDDDLAQVMALAPAHVSVYGLTVEPATPLARWRDRAVVTEAPDERYEHEFLAAHNALSAEGYEHYEVSNYARAGQRARHNSSYWRHVPYAGFGPSAHSFDGAARKWNAREYTEWSRRVRDGRDPVDGAEVLTEENLTAERIYLGLRTVDGLDLAAVGSMDRAECDRVERWIQAGWGEFDGRHVRLTPTGWLRLDAMAADLTVTSSKSYI
ncbi:MAG TPA: radical SAM family heme chaperone HemW [Gemmatimonadaceae bacterium]|jgi:oxygen-independent coproporphyrinogen-3 oxidase